MIKPFVLIVLDGLGHCDSRQNNAIALAKMPYWNHLIQKGVSTFISASGEDVGLPQGQMGNSEVGHMNLGAGRIVYQDLTRIDRDIRNGEFFQNTVLKKAVKEGKRVHILGLLSPGGVHSHESHIQAMVTLALEEGAAEVYLHAFLDGRDTPPQSAEASLVALEKQLHESGRGRIASLIGRYYAMDRDKRWERVQSAYELLTQDRAEFSADSAVQGLKAAYARGESDEFVKATRIVPSGKKPIQIESGDSVIVMNFRSDRARELTHAFVDEKFEGFPRDPRLSLAAYVTLTEYEAGLPVSVAYAPQNLKNVLGEVLSERGMTQLRIAETEKYAHVTFFFNGGNETPLKGETRILVPSPKVATYDLQPEMSAPLLTQKLVEAIESKKFDVIICNYANPDMVGHTGNLEATIRAIEVIDECLGKIDLALQSVGGEMIITADHGNAEKMYDELSHQAHTAHTSYPVPLVYVGRKLKVLVQNGRLSDVAPTMLALMDIPIPKEMTGRVLLG